jgi:hypothetical protein
MKLYTASRHWTCQCGCDGQIKPGDSFHIDRGEILLPGHGSQEQEQPNRTPESKPAQEYSKQLTLF